MTEQKNSISFSLKLILWSARTLSLLLFLFWGAFFVEHLQFFWNGPGQPPIIVYFITTFHLLLLLSYMVAAWKHFFGSILMVVTGLVFFVLTSGKMFLPFYLISIVPASFYLYYWKNTKDNTMNFINGDKNDSQRKSD